MRRRPPLRAAAVAPRHTTMPEGLSWQASLFADDAGADMSFDGLVRHHLDERSWIDYVPGWLARSGELFDTLLRAAPWQQRRRHMYDKVVEEPRMVAAWGMGDTPLDLPPRLEAIRRTLSERYATEFDSVLINLYRDGRDSVAWHGDTVRKVLADPLVATVSLGSRRKFLLRRGTGGPVRATFEPGEGDLLMMGGACQHDWQHTVPKSTAVSGARMSITLRHSTPAGSRRILP